MDRGSKASPRPRRTIPPHALGWRLYSVPDWSRPLFLGPGCTCDARLSSPSDPRAQRGKTSLPVRQLPRRAPPRPDSRPVLPWQQTLLTHSLAHSTWLPRQQTITLMRFGACFIYVYLPVDFDASASSPGPARSSPSGAASSSLRPTCNRERSRRGVSTTRFLTHTLPQSLDEKESEE